MTDQLKNFLKTIQKQTCIHPNTIGEKLNISVDEIINQVKILHTYGIKIHLDPLQGYQLETTLELLDEEKLRNELGAHNLLVDYYLTLDSTNTYLMRSTLPYQKAHLCVAEHQAKGKGRMNRKWSSPFGENIYLSLKIKVNKHVNELLNLSLVIAVIVAQTLHKLDRSLELKIKWPNDVYLEGKKLNGTLIEIKTVETHATEVIIGIGINVNMLEATQIDQPWISLKQVLKKHIERTELIIHLTNHLLKGLALFEHAGFQAFNEVYKDYDYLYNKAVKVMHHATIFEGQASGIGEDGSLKIINPQGTYYFSSGETLLIQ